MSDGALGARIATVSPAEGREGPAGAEPTRTYGPEPAMACQGLPGPARACQGKKNLACKRTSPKKTKPEEKPESKRTLILKDLKTLETEKPEN